MNYNKEKNKAEHQPKLHLDGKSEKKKVEILFMLLCMSVEVF
jgi:hypothetical protein